MGLLQHDCSPHEPIVTNLPIHTRLNIDLTLIQPRQTTMLNQISMSTKH